MPRVPGRNAGARLGAPVPMTYASILEAYGWERFAEERAPHGAESLIVADLPAGERHDLRRIQLVAPTSTDERVALAARGDRRLAVPGHADRDDRRARRSLPRARRPGRARSRRDRQAALRRFRDLDAGARAARCGAQSTAIVVGSRALEVAEEGPAALEAYVGSLRDALDG